MVAITEFPPYTYTNDQGVIGGSYVELLKQQLDCLGLDYRFISRPTARIFHQLRAAEVDIWVGPRGIPFLQNFVSEVGLKEQDKFYIYLWHLPETRPVVTLEELQHQSLAVLTGFSYGGFIKKVTDPRHKIQLQYASSHKNGLKMLVSGRVDYFLDYHQPMMEALAEMPTVTLSKQPMVALAGGFIVATNNAYGGSLAEALEQVVKRNYLELDAEAASNFSPD